MSYVLVVDDEKPIRAFLRRRLEAWGYHVREASSATEALEMMLSDPAAITISDIRMPGHDGLWLAERIRDRWSTTAITIATGAGGESGWPVMGDYSPADNRCVWSTRRRTLRLNSFGCS